MWCRGPLRSPLNHRYESLRQVASGLRIAGVERLRDAHAGEGFDRRREIDEGEPPSVTPGRQDERTRIVRATQARIDDDGHTGPSSAGHPDDVARLECSEALGDGGTVLRPPGFGPGRLEVAQLASQALVLHEVT